MFFSVIIPTYNRAYQLNDALFSAFSQAGLHPKEWEVVVVDNSSTDGTMAVAEKYSRSSGGRLKYIRVNNGGIIALSRNAGIQRASGDYVAFLDDDDVWSEDKLAVCLNTIVNTRADGVYHGIRTVDRDMIPKQTSYKEMLKNGNRDIALSAMVLRKGVFREVGPFDEDPLLVGSEDFEMWLRIFGSVFNYNVVAIPQVLGACSPGGFSTRSAERQTHSEILAFKKEFMRRPQMRPRGVFTRVYLRGAARCEDPEARKRLLVAAAKSVIK